MEKIDALIKEADKIISVKTIQGGVSKVSNTLIKRLLPGHLMVNGYYTYIESGTKTIIFLEK